MVCAYATDTTEEVAFMRSGLYRLFSWGFRFPTPTMFQKITSGTFLSELWESLTGLPYLRLSGEHPPPWHGEIGESPVGMDLDDFISNYGRAFEGACHAIPCSPCGSLNGGNGQDRSALILEMSETYHRFGLKQFQTRGSRQQPNHLCAQLELLCLLAFREAHAYHDDEPTRLREYLSAQKNLLQCHVLMWVPSFSRALNACAQIPFYPRLIRVASAFMRADLAWLDHSLEKLGQEKLLESCEETGRQDAVLQDSEISSPAQ
jgi:putative dimethyl sulfoxide reductase chaperone